MRVIEIIYLDLANCSISLSISFFILCFAKTPNTAPIFQIKVCIYFISVLNQILHLTLLSKPFPLIPFKYFALEESIRFQEVFYLCFISFLIVNDLFSVDVLSDCSTILKALYFVRK